MSYPRKHRKYSQEFVDYLMDFDGCYCCSCQYSFRESDNVIVCECPYSSNYGCLTKLRGTCNNYRSKTEVLVNGF